jgi:hypothetical protein
MEETMFLPRALYPTVRYVVFRLATAVAVIVVLFNFRLEAQDTTTVLTAPMLKRIAEAVDSRRNGEVVFIVMNRDSVTVAGAAPTRIDAERIRKRLGDPYIVLGPYRGKIDLGLLADIIPAFCVHDRLTSNMVGRICDGGTIRYSLISSMSLTLKMHDGSARTIALPSGTDAIFLSYSAYDKFVFPYYERVIGLEATAAMRQRMLSGDAQR